MTLRDVEAEVRRLGGVVGAPDGHLPTFGFSEENGRPHVEVDSRGYHYVCAERGLENSRLTTGSLDELLYHVMKDVCFSLASDYAAAHRRRGEDSRRLLFSQKLKLMQQLSSDWGVRQGLENAEILRRHPFDDNVELRADLCSGLRGQGRSAEEAWELACRKYPLPSR